ncbi:MAG: elongation factor P [Candidatus Harrisonbacteria bacterium]|nr:elongation factor P [Candidatus Harrisonbacteria bacterium]
MALSYNDLKPGIVFLYEGRPHQVLKADFLRKQQRKPVMQTEIKNLLTRKVLQRNFQMNESFEEADMEKENVKYLYNNKGQYWFCDLSDPSKRFSISEDIAGYPAQFIKANTEVQILRFNGSVISINWPIKAELIVKETPPGEKGDTASGGSKKATLETGAVINVPFFINTGDIVKVNTQAGEYSERIEKAKGDF